MHGLEVKLIDRKTGITGCDFLELNYLKFLDENETRNAIGEHDCLMSMMVYYKDDGSFFWLAKLDKKAVGFCWASDLGDILYSNKVYVVPEFRGRGIAQKLKAAQIEFARKGKYSKIETTIWHENTASLRVHEKFGFNFYPGEFVTAVLDLTQKGSL
jgi:RimJ/RimL family protein N-acetyltransferase